MRRGDQRCRQGQLGPVQQDCRTGCVLFGNPGSGFPCVGTRVGSREAVSLLAYWYSWENNPTRDSWEHVGAPERALLGGSCFPRDTGSFGESVQ